MIRRIQLDLAFGEKLTVEIICAFPVGLWLWWRLSDSCSYALTLCQNWYALCSKVCTYTPQRCIISNKVAQLCFRHTFIQMEVKKKEIWQKYKYKTNRFSFSLKIFIDIIYNMYKYIFKVQYVNTSCLISHNIKTTFLVLFRSHLCHQNSSGLSRMSCGKVIWLEDFCSQQIL